MVAATELEGLSYSAQYDALFRQPLNPRVRVPRPSTEEQKKEPRAARIVGSDVYASKMLNNWADRENWSIIDLIVTGFIVGLHVLCLWAPFTFSWSNLGLASVLFFLVGCLGIDVSFHRQLTHRSFATPTWLEYTLAVLGTLGLEQDPLEWVRHHRFHHQNCDTPLDPHSTYEGFFWAHCGWLMHEKVLKQRAGANWIVSDLAAQPFYRAVHYLYPLAVPLQFIPLWYFGGWSAVIWGGAVRQVAMWHVTWLVNSACHIWGQRPYATGDLSTNNAWLAVPTFGESWHNNHHAFPYSARHGLEWWQVDIAWYIIRGLKALGLAWDIRLPTEAQKQKMAAANQGTKDDRNATDGDDASEGVNVADGAAAAVVADSGIDTKTE